MTGREKNIVEIGTCENFPEPQWLGRVQDFVLKVLELCKVEDWECSITFCDDDFIKNLNSQYRNMDEPTDVLSFESNEKYERDGRLIFCAGDILISIPALMRNAEEFSVSADDELKRLLIHGILHLAGNDHGQFHIGKDGTILDENENVPVFEKLPEENKKECEMLILQEGLLEKVSEYVIIEK